MTSALPTDNFTILPQKFLFQPTKFWATKARFQRQVKHHDTSLGSEKETA